MPGRVVEEIAAARPVAGASTPIPAACSNCLPQIDGDTPPLPALRRDAAWARMMRADRGPRPVRDLRPPADAVEAVRGVSLRVAEGESFGIVGESGSGKSTVLRAICRPRADRPAGAIAHRRRRRWQAPREPAFYRQVQMVFQDPYGSLHPRHTVDRVLAEPLAIHGFDDRETRIERALDDVGLGTGSASAIRTSSRAASASASPSPAR